MKKTIQIIVDIIVAITNPRQAFIAWIINRLGLLKFAERLGEVEISFALHTDLVIDFMRDQKQKHRAIEFHLKHFENTLKHHLRRSELLYRLLEIEFNPDVGYVWNAETDHVLAHKSHYFKNRGILDVLGKVVIDVFSLEADLAGRAERAAEFKEDVEKHLTGMNKSLTNQDERINNAFTSTGRNATALKQQRVLIDEIHPKGQRVPDWIEQACQLVRGMEYAMQWQLPEHGKPQHVDAWNSSVLNWMNADMANLVDAVQQLADAAGIAYCPVDPPERETMDQA